MNDRSELAVEILHNAKRKKDNNEKLTRVEEVVLREWAIILKSQLQKLELKGQRQVLTDIEHAEVQALCHKISKYCPELLT